MQTDALIRALALDAARPAVPVSRLVAGALLAGVIASVTLFAIALRPRPDIALALYSPGFCLKLAVTACLAASAATLLAAVARPLPLGRSLNVLTLGPLLLAAGVAIELVALPADSWHGRLIGRNAPHCLALIPMLSAAPAALLMFALRRAAPARPGLAGMIIGLTAGGIGATLYAFTCPDDSALFVGAWYSFAIVIVTGACFIVGRRLLRW